MSTNAATATTFADQSADLRTRLYANLCLTAAIAAVVVIIPVNLLEQLPPITNVGTLVFATLSVALYAGSRRGYVYPSAILVGALLVLNTGWFPNAGSQGSITYYYFALFCLPLIFYTGWRRWSFFAGTVANLLVLLALEHQHPEWITPFRDEHARLADLMGSIVVAATLLAVLLRMVLNEYLRERRHLHRALGQVDASQAQLKAMIDSTDEIVWQVGVPSYGLTAFNTAFARAVTATFGLEPQAGLTPADFMGEPHASDWRAIYDRALTEGPFEFEYTVPPTGHVLLHSVRPVVHGGRVVGVSVFGRDVTERKRAEAREREHAHQVVESQRLESLGTLAGGVAHDFNNMLGAIMGHADLLLGDERDQDRREHLSSILTASRRSADLVGKLLAFGRRGRNLVEAVDLDAVVRDCLSMLAPSFRPDIVVRTALGATSTVDGDPSQLHQVVVNLCLNAADAMPAGGVLEVATEDVGVAGDGEEASRVVLRVTDSGTGIADEVKAHIFEPFFTTKTPGAGSGTGLGLSTVHGIVHLHQGTIDVVSQPGHGATFIVSFPRGTLLAGTPPLNEEATAPGRGIVLVIEDEPQLRTFAARALVKLGYRTAVAADGEEGVGVFRAQSHEIAAVLLDLKMPRKDGAATFREIRAIAPDVPVLICTGYGDNDEAQALISEGACGLLSKPYRIAELGERLAAILATSRAIPGTTRTRAGTRDR